MEVSAWSSGSGTYGVRVGAPNRGRYFKPTWGTIEVEIDGHMHQFALTQGFWKKCPEFRDSGSTAIRDWIQRHHQLDWPTGRPPQFQLLPIGGNRFSLVP